MLALAHVHPLVGHPQLDARANLRARDESAPRKAPHALVARGMPAARPLVSAYVGRGAAGVIRDESPARNRAARKRAPMRSAGGVTEPS